MAIKNAWCKKYQGNSGELLAAPFVALRSERKSTQSVVIGQVIKNVVIMCLMHQCDYTSHKKETGPMALAALTAHHTSTLMSCNGNSWINMGF